MDAGHVLSVERLRVDFGGVRALNVQRLELPDVGTTAALLMGPNGAGKTTLLDVVSGFARPTNDATIRLRVDRDITNLSRVQKVRAGVVRTFQRPPVFPSLSVEETIAFAASPSGVPRGTARRSWPYLVEALVEALGISDILTQSAGLLPLHTLRRVELVRVLATQPRLLMLDEPTAGSDDREREHLCHLLSVALPELIGRFYAAGEYRFASLSSCVVTHDLKFATLLSNGQSPAPIVHVLAQGQLRASGRLRDLTQDTELRSSYFGEQ
jgi:ABC-type branched-subunit amino acid transport system ATPase component